MGRSLLTLSIGFDGATDVHPTLLECMPQCGEVTLVHVNLGIDTQAAAETIAGWSN
jgi:hypothetical protein